MFEKENDSSNLKTSNVTVPLSVCLDQNSTLLKDVESALINYDKTQNS